MQKLCKRCNYVNKNEDAKKKKFITSGKNGIISFNIS